VTPDIFRDVDFLSNHGAAKKLVMPRTILCFGDSNTFGTLPMRDPDDSRRLGPNERWPGVVRGLLGPEVTVIEEGLPGRTTVFDDPVEGENRSGRRFLAVCLESHRPLDIVVVMLGTNDLKGRFGLPATDIARGASILLEIARTHPKLIPGPRLLLVCPPAIEEVGWIGEIFPGGAAKSRLLPPLYAQVARRHGAIFLDAGTVISSSPVDGIHFDAPEHRALGHAIADTLRLMLAAGG
jgi:lysophospholipase L1-like esterase